MRTLVIAPHFPLPETVGSSMRTMNFVRYFKRLGEVDLLTRKEGDGPQEGGDWFSRTYLLDFADRGEGRRHVVLRAVEKLVRLKSWATAHYTVEKERAVERIVSEGNYDLILCRYAGEAYPLLRLGAQLKKKVILDVDDIVTDSVHAAETRGLTGIGRLTGCLDRYILRKYYHRCLGFGSILFCSGADRTKAGTPSTIGRMHVVPNTPPGIDLPDNYQRDGYGNVDQLLFVGSLRYGPNLQGITWFITKVYPGALEAFPDLKLRVVGKNPPAELAGLIGRYPGIELHGDVADLVPWYERCGVVVVPLLSGGGTRIKILEAGCARRPVLSTEIGAYGLGLSDGEELLTFPDADGFLERYRRLRSDRELYTGLSQKLSDHVYRHHSFESFCSSMSRVLTSLERPAVYDAGCTLRGG